jgi:transposase-like protein
MPSRYIRKNNGYRTKPHSGKKSPPTGTDADLNLVTMLPLFTDEEKAREFVEAKRWPNGPVCPHCQSTEAYKLTAKPGSKKPVRPGIYKCKACRQQFSVRVGTIFEDSKLPICKWLMATHLMAAGKNDISSHEMSRLLGVTQKTAWFVCHRLREAMRLEPVAGMLSGTIEADETFIGARKPRYKGKRKGPSGAKKPVMALVERGGSVVAFPIKAANATTLKGSVRELVDDSSTVMTDSHRCYIGLDKHFDGGHHSVNHTKGEYVRVEQCGEVIVSTNTAESFFARIERSFIGTHHKMSAKHLHRYVTETMFRWNTRKMADGVRMVAVIKGAEGKRLMYRQPR